MDMDGTTTHPWTNPHVQEHDTGRYMMRQLTSKQKKLLKGWHSANKNIHSVEDLTPDQWTELEKVNDSEILWQEANRFLSDLHFAQV